MIINSIGDYSAIFEICKNKDKNFNKIELDFTQTKFINPCDVLLTAQSVIYIHTFNPNAELILITRGITGKYLNDIGLIDFCNKNYTQSQTIDFIRSQTAMPIRRVDQSHIEEYIMNTIHYIGQFCNGKDLTMLSVGIKEAINNVHDHSQSDIGAYVFCQYFPTNNTIKICVSDMGTGIPANVKTQLPELSDMDCIKWAIRQSNTTKSTKQNAGCGLTNIVDFVKTNNGNLQILSGTGRYVLNKKDEYTGKNVINHFIGTLIEFSIIVDNLENEENIETQYFL